MGIPTIPARILAAAAAIAVGTGIAYYQRSSSGDLPLDGGPAARPANEQATTATAAPAPSAAGTGTAPAAPVESAAGRHADTPGDAAAMPSGPAADAGEPAPAPLPEFFVDGLGPPPMETDGSVTEGSPHALQDRLDQERRDPAWADKVEWELQNFLDLQPFRESLETTDVLCRATVCRVTATTNRTALPDSPEDGWQGMMSSLRYERVSNEFSRSTDVVVLKASEPHRIGFVTYFERTD